MKFIVQIYFRHNYHKSAAESRRKTQTVYKREGDAGSFVSVKRTL